MNIAAGILATALIWLVDASAWLLRAGLIVVLAITLFGAAFTVYMFMMEKRSADALVIGFAITLSIVAHQVMTLDFGFGWNLLPFALLSGISGLLVMELTGFDDQRRMIRAIRHRQNKG